MGFEGAEVFEGDAGLERDDFERQAFLQPPVFETGSERMGLVRCHRLLTSRLDPSMPQSCREAQRTFISRNATARGGHEYVGLGFPLQLWYNPPA